MRKCLTKFTCIFEFGAVQRFVNLVDLEKCCKMTIWLLSLAVHTAENKPLKVCQKLAKFLKLEKLEKT